jgi:hypothetical protein
MYIRIYLYIHIYSSIYIHKHMNAHVNIYMVFYLMRTKSQMLNKLFYGTESIKKLLLKYCIYSYAYFLMHVYMYISLHMYIQVYKNTHFYVNKCIFICIGGQNLRC